MTSTGAIANIAQIQATEVETPVPVEGINGSFYGWAGRQQSCGFRGPCFFNFSFDLTGNVQYYTPTPNAIIPAVALPDGRIMGGSTDIARITPNGSLVTLHKCPKNYQCNPMPILGADGNFYGIARDRFVSALVYRLTPQGELKILKEYQDIGKYAPYEYLVQGRGGMLYGTVAQGGDHGAGAVFRLSTDGEDFKFLYSFPYLIDGIPSFLIEGSDGNLYGGALGELTLGGASSLFRVSPDGKFARLQVLDGITEGHCPCFLALGSDGKFYGTISIGGPGGGTAFVWDVGMPKPKPKLTVMWPSRGGAGTSVILSGTQLLGATAVSFNGMPANTFSNVGGQFVSATVPAGATSGPVAITTMNGTATSQSAFTVE